MTPVAAFAVASSVPTIVCLRRYSPLVALAWLVAFAVVAPLELIGLAPLLGTWHPLRVGIPLVMGTLALYDAHDQCASWGAIPRGYVMAILTFALAGVDGAALFFHEKCLEWIVPGFTMLVSAMICIVRVIPKGRISWLLS
jgi:hypothetical protein